MKTPGVIIVEKNPFPSSVEEIPTAVPAFIGHTEKALDGKKSLINQPLKITSLSDYSKYFGYGPSTSFNLAVVKGGDGESPEVFVQDDASYGLNLVDTNYLMWNSIRMFFDNGGGDCYIVSVGGYDDAIDASALAGTGKNAGKGLSTLAKEEGATIVVIPDLMSMIGKSAQGDCISVQKEMLAHCGDVMKNRVAILDVYEGYKDRKDAGGDVVDKFRNDLGDKFLDYGCAYYPWLETTVMQASEVGIQNLDTAGRKTLQEVLNKELFPSGVDDDPRSEILKDFIDQITTDISADERSQLQTALMTMSPIFKKVLVNIRAQLNVMPPSGAMAGVFTANDNNKGVWKAPANVALNTVKKLTVDVSEEGAEDLSATPSGKSVNSIRKIAGQGIMVWGGKTLDGNSEAWQNINVRRTTIMIEESAKGAIKDFAAGPNDDSTWGAIKEMLDKFLTELWRFGAFAGGRPEDAFQVTVGLGSTMTEKDVKAGIMRVSISMALTRPAEYTVVTFEQKVKKS
jgi:phage tail sheath protein FI